MTPEAKMEVLLAAMTPPLRDFVFEAEVARRVAFRRAWMTVVALLPWIVIGTVLLWALARTAGPALAAMAEALAPTALALAAAAAGVALAFGILRRLNAP